MAQFEAATMQPILRKLRLWPAEHGLRSAIRRIKQRLQLCSGFGSLDTQRKPPPFGGLRALGLQRPDARDDPLASVAILLQEGAHPLHVDAPTIHSKPVQHLVKHPGFIATENA